MVCIYLDADSTEFSSIFGSACKINIWDAFFFFLFSKNLYFKNIVVYCSDTGTVAPERCVFGIMLDVSAFLGNTHTHIQTT